MNGQSDTQKGLIWGLGLMVYSGWIFYLSSGIVSVPGPDFMLKDKVMHAGAYGLLAFTAWQTFRQWSAVRRPWIGAWIYAAGYGASDELHQSFVPGRNSDPWDWVADAVGAALCLLVVEMIRRHQENQEDPALYFYSPWTPETISQKLADYRSRPPNRKPSPRRRSRRRR